MIHSNPLLLRALSPTSSLFFLLFYFAPYRSWCAELMNGQYSTRARYAGDCSRREENSILCRDGTPTFFGQYNQDAWLYNTFFAYLERPGVYLDVVSSCKLTLQRLEMYAASLCMRKSLCRSEYAILTGFRAPIYSPSRRRRIMPST